jgi:ATP/ADP translocase/HEAT repeat protein
MLTWICRLLHIKEDELGKLAIAFLIYFLVLTGIVIGRNARDSIFLVNVGIQYLPYMYILNAVCVVLCSLVYTFFVDRMERTSFVVRTSLIFFAMMAGCKLALLSPVPAVTVVASVFSYAAVQVIWLISLMMFWTLAGDYFDTRQSKRLFPLIGAGGLVGMIAAGLGSSALVKAVRGTDNLFLVWAGLILLSAVLVRLMKRLYGRTLKNAITPPAPANGGKQESDLKESFEYLKGSKLLKNMAGITLFLWIVFTVIDYEFNLTMRAKYPNKDDLTAAIGLMRGLAGFVSLIVQFLLTQKLVKLLGVARAVLIHPVFDAAASLLMSVKYGFWSVYTAKFGDQALLYTVQDSSYQMLYNPIPPDKRGRARALVEGYIKPVSMGIAGLVVVVSAAFLPASRISILAFILALAWIGFSIFTQRAYVDALVKNLKTDGGHDKTRSLRELNRLSAADNLLVLREVLRGNDAEGVKYALETVEFLGQKDLAKDILGRAADYPPENRALAVRVLGSFGLKELREDFKRFAEDSSVGVRVEALRSLASVADEEELPFFESYTGSPDMPVRREALVAAIRVGGLDGIIAVVERMKLLVKSDLDEDKTTVCEIIAAVRIKYFFPDLVRYLEDASLEIRGAAVHALSKLRDDRAFRLMVSLLDDRRFMRLAMKGLVNYDERYTRNFLNSLRDNPSPLVRQNLVRVIDRSGTHDVFKELPDFLSDTDVFVRGEILHALVRRFRPERFSDKLRTVLLKHIGEEIDRIYLVTWGNILFRKRYPGHEGDVLEISLREETSQMIDNLFHALGMLTDPRVMLEIHRDLTGEDPKKQSLAWETLENVGMPEITARLAPLFDDRPPSELEAVFRRDMELGEFLRSLLEGQNIWLRAAAVYALGLAGDATYLDAVKKYVGHPDPLLAENAAFAVARMTGNKE